LKDWRFLFGKYLLRRQRIPFYEKRVKKRLQLFRGSLFVDIGANQGPYALDLAKNFHHVYAFEPNPAIVRLLKQRLAAKGISNVKIFAMALGDQVGRTMLYLDSRVGIGGSVDTILSRFDYNPKFIPKGGRPYVYEGKNGVDVELSTYDAVVREPADLVKIDVEGAEFLVLAGMKASLACGNVKNLVVELHDHSRRGDLENRLSQFKLEWLDSDHLLGVFDT
jgi:FkbM family methyltransferase